MEVLKNLSEEEVTALRERFAEPLPQAEFEAVLTEFVARMPSIDLGKLRLTELFNDIDANGDMSVSWDEFTMYLIDAAALEATLATSGRDAVIKQYRPLTTLDDEVPGSVASMRYIPALNRVVKIIQREKYSKIRLCHPTPTLGSWMEAPRSDSTVLAYDYIPSRPTINTSNVLCVSTNDNVVRYLDVARHAMSTSSLIKQRRSLPVPEAQTALHWCAEHNKLLMGSRSGVISVVNPDEPTPVNTERIHESVTQAILSSNGIMYSAALDSTIKLTDLNRGMVKHTIEGPHSHTQGVFLLAMSTQQQLFSAGLEAYVLVHSLSNSKMKPQKLLDKNRPHHGRIVSLDVLSDSPQVITGDSSGLVKIWDTRTLSCVQTISIVKDDVFNVAAAGGANLTSVGYIEKNKMLCVNGRTTKVFGYDTASNPHLSDDTGCTLVVFNPLSRTFMSVHKTTIKLWDGQTGALRGVHNNIVSSDITAVAIAVPRMRKIIVGTLSGDLYAFGYAMCTPIGDFAPAYTSPTASVVALWYLDGFKENRGQYILTVYKREVVLVPDADENASRSAITLHCFQDVLKDHQAKALAVTENKTVLVATEASTIYVCDLGTFTLAAIVKPTGLTGDICSLTAFPDTLTPFVADGRELAGHVDLNASFALSPNSKPNPGAQEFPTSAEGSVRRKQPSSRNRRRSLLTNLEESHLGHPTGASQTPPRTAGGGEAGGNRSGGPATMQFYRRLATGVAFVADSVGSVAAVLMHSAQAMDTIVTWRNLNAEKRKKKQRRRHKNGPAIDPAEKTVMVRKRQEDDEAELIAATSEGSMLLRPAMSFAVGDVANMLSTGDYESDDENKPQTAAAAGAEHGNVKAPPALEVTKVGHAPKPPKKTSPTRNDDESSDGTDSGESDGDDGINDSPSKRVGFAGVGSNPPSRDGGRSALNGEEDEQPVDVRQLLGSRPNSAVAAYFDERVATVPDGTGRRRVVKTEYAPVVTAMCFLADGHILVTGDESGYVTAWDVDLIVRKAARASAKRNKAGGGGGDNSSTNHEEDFAQPQPTPIASWRAHSDEVVSISEAFGERTPGGGVSNTGAVIATASIDRNCFLWTTDGVSLGNLAQGRIPDDDNVLPEGIKPYTLDDPPSNAWAITDEVRRKREIVAKLADAARDARSALHVNVPSSGAGRRGEPIVGFGSPLSPLSDSTGSPSVGDRLAAKAFSARSRLAGSTEASRSQSPRSPSGRAASSGPASGTVSGPPSPSSKPMALQALSERSDSPLTPVVASKDSPRPAGHSRGSATNPVGSRGGAGSMTPPPASSGFFVTEVADMGSVVKGYPAASPKNGPSAAMAHVQDSSNAFLDDDQLTSVSAHPSGPYVPKELKGIVAGERFKLPLIGKGKPPRRLGNKAMKDSAATPRPSLASLSPRQTASDIRREAEEDVAKTARAKASSAPATMPAGPPARTRHGTKIPQAPSKDGAPSIGKHLSVATQRYLHTLGFDDNPQENPEQKALRHHGTVVIKRPVAPTDPVPSRRVL